MFRRTLDRHGRLEHGAARSVPGRLALTRSTARFSRLRRPRVQEEQVQFSTASSPPSRWDTWCNRLRSWTTLPPRHTGQSDSHSKPRLRVTEPWRANGPSRSLRGACWTATPGGALRLDLGGRRNFLTIWCRIHDLHGVQRRPFLGRSTGLVIEHVSLGQATRNDTRRSCSKKAAAWRSLRRLVAQAVGNPAAWRKGRTSQYTSQRSVHTVASISLPDLGPRDPGWDFPSREALAHTLCNAATSGETRSHGSCFSSRATRNTQSMLRLQIRRVAGGNGRRKHAGGRPAQGTPSPRLGSAAASRAGWHDRSCWSSKWRRGDMVAAMVGWAQGECQAACRPGGLGRSFCHDLHSKRSTMFARHTRAPLDWDTTASTPRLFCSCQANCECDSSICSWLARPSWSNLCAGLT